MRACAALFAACVVAGHAWAADVPFLSGRVVDDAEILSPATRERLAAALKSHEEKTTNQVAVLTVPTIGQESIEEYATRVFEQWKLGQQGKDNGVLVIVVPKDRKMRIEVGYGLEGTLTDAISSRIIRNEMTPQFKSGNYDGGVENGVNAIVARLEGGAEPAAEPAPSSSGNAFSLAMSGMDEPDLPPWPMRILLGCFIFGIIGLFTIIGVMTPGRRLVPVPVPDPVLGDVPDHHRGRKRRTRAAHDLLDRIPAREAHHQPLELVREGEEGPQVQGNRDDRRLHDEFGQQQRLELVVRQFVVGWILGRRRQLRRGRQLGQLVGALRIPGGAPPTGPATS